MRTIHSFSSPTGFEQIDLAKELTASYQFTLDGVSDLNAKKYGSTCLNCERTMSWSEFLYMAMEVNTLVCSDTCNRLEIDDVYPSEEDLISVETGQEFTRTYWHATNRENWGEDIISNEEHMAILHAGSKISALYRAEELLKENPEKEIFLYSFTLTEKAQDQFIPEIVQDMETLWPEHTGESDSKRIRSHFSIQEKTMHSLDGEKHKVACYINDWEIAGELSIVFTGDAVDQTSISRETLTTKSQTA